MSRLSDHISITIHRDGEATCDVELDKFMAKMSDEIFELLKTSDKIDRETAEEKFADWMGAHLVKTMTELSDESFNELLMKLVDEFGGTKSPTNEDLDAKAIASGGVGGIPVMPVSGDDGPQD